MPAGCAVCQVKPLDKLLPRGASQQVLVQVVQVHDMFHRLEGCGWLVGATCCHLAITASLCREPNRQHNLHCCTAPALSAMLVYMAPKNDYLGWNTRRSLTSTLSGR